MGCETAAAELGVRFTDMQWELPSALVERLTAIYLAADGTVRAGPSGEEDEDERQERSAMRRRAQSDATGVRSSR